MSTPFLEDPVDLALRDNGVYSQATGRLQSQDI